MAIRRDLAEAGIGFGIFDLDIPLYAQLESKVMKHKTENGYMKHLTGPGSSPPTTPITPTLLRLPFSLISPDLYSHSDGVARTPLSRQDIVLQFAPAKRIAHKTQLVSKVVPGKFVRNFRWGALDVMDASHCEFLHLRGALFHHMEVYTFRQLDRTHDTHNILYLLADAAKVHTRVLVREVQDGGATACSRRRSPTFSAGGSISSPADAGVPAYSRDRHRSFSG